MTPEQPVGPETSPTEEQGEKKKKKKDKVREVWISFTGRIVAQLLGAAATVVLGLIVVQNYADRDRTASDAPKTETPAASRVTRTKPARSKDGVSIAVLPLSNYSGDPKQEYFADGMTEALIADLAQIDGLHVISRTSSMRYKVHQKALPESADELGVDYVVEGSVVKAGERVRITAQLIDAKTDEHIWSQNYNSILRDVLSVQAEVATSIARAVRVALTPTEQGRLAQRRPVDPAVYDIYLQGRHSWNLRTPAGLQDAIRYFEQALKKDPDFALAHAGLADTYSLLGTAGYTTQTVPDAMVRAKASAERALALDNSLAEVHTSLGRVLYYYEWDWPAAERAYRRALDLNRGYATAHQWYATLLSEQGRDQEAISEAQRALALDPQSAIMHMTLGSIHYNGRRYELAVASEQRALELDLNALAPRLILAGSFMAQGNARAAIEVCERAPSPLHPLILATLSSAYSRAGDSKRASEFRQQLLARPDLTAAALLRLHAGSGDKEAFFPALERAINERSDIIPRLKVSPLFDSVRTDGRFVSFLNRLRLS